MTTYVGHICEYWSVTTSQWISTHVTHEVIEGDQIHVQVNCKKGFSMPFDTEQLRWPTAEVSSAAMEISTRQRGQHCDQASTLVNQMLEGHGSVARIFEHYSESFAEEGRRKQLSDEMLSVFPKKPQETGPGVCYLNFSHPPSTACVQGNLHPNMLSYQHRAYDLWMPYAADFLREINEIWTHGFTGQLKISVAAGSTGAQHGWSVFAWGPDGTYKDFVQASAISFLSISAALQELTPPDWLVSDFVSLQAKFERRSSALERGIFALRASIKESKTSRLPDPFMMDWMLRNAGWTTSAKANDFVK